jgi:hypothetical protein
MILFIYAMSLRGALLPFATTAKRAFGKQSHGIKQFLAKSCHEIASLRSQ